MIDNIKFNVGLYIRLSKEDADNENESESITNQRDFLKEYIANNGFNLIEEYIDDGYSGTNFDRPAFIRMIKDIENGKINCVITKDMSRLGRDYIGIGNYIEKYFPEHQTRYIAINDNIDTIDGKIDDITPFKAIINDYYAKDISKKVKSAINTMKKQGKFLGGIAPYGYKFKSEDNHKELVIDKETAKVVRRMFKMYINGASLHKIADTLNNENIPIPSIQKRLKRGSKSSAYGNWQTRTIDEILKNPTYIGNLTQGRRKKINYKSKKIIRVPKNEWIIVENTHEAIIDKDTFEKVQNIYEKNKNRNYIKNNLLFSGFIYCKECGHKIGMNKNINNKYYCSCNYYKKYSKLGLCTSHSIPYEALENRILKEIRRECMRSVKVDDILNILKKNIKKEKNKENLLQKISKKKNDIQINKNAIEDLYIEKLKKEIDGKRYKNIYNKLNEKINVLLKELKTLEADYDSLVNNELTNNDIDYIKVIKEYLKMIKPSRELLANLIDKITIDEDKNINIYYKIKNTY